MYHTRKVKSISKFSIFDVIKRDKLERPIPEEQKNNPRYKNLNNIEFSYFFWERILSSEFLKSFLLDTYANHKKDDLSTSDYKTMIGEMKFVLTHVDLAKQVISFTDKEKIPKGDDVFFSFKLFNSLLYFVNDYFSGDELFVSLKDGIHFNREITKIEDLSNHIEYYMETSFADFFLKPMVEEHVEPQENIIYKFEIFWPNELPIVGVMGDYIKKINPSAKIAIDFSGGNEQFDFTQWVDLIVSSGDGFFKYYDYFIIDRDFGNGLNSVKEYLDGNIALDDVKNIILYENDAVVYNKVEKDDLTTDIFQDFIHSTYSEKTITKMVGDNAVFARFLPYKCYWSNCSFCAINSQNKFSYDTHYSYDYFIDKWIEFIKKFDIRTINFKDEAIPPSVIIKFAKKLVDNKMVVNYQFRTRMERMYNLENCRILAESGCGYCGTGLESAIDRINEEIAGKGNRGVNIHDKLRIIHNFDKVGVSFHNYSIMGFPGETDREAAVTYKFMKDNIINSNFYTCTPNIFALMKGPKIFSEKESYGIEVPQEELDNPFCLIFSFTCHGKPRNLPLLHKFAEDLHKTQFLPWLPNNGNTRARDFWDYIDRSYIFYLLKKYHSKNPFYKYMDVNKQILTQDKESVLGAYFHISKYFQIIDKTERLHIYNWVGSDNMLYIDMKYADLLLNYKSEKTLGENIIDLNLPKDSGLEQTIIYLLENRLLLDQSTYGK